MGEITNPSQVLLLVAVSSCHEEAFTWARQRAAHQFGQLATASTVFDFNETDYYLPTMGPNLKKQFLAYDQLCEPDRLPAIKKMTNDWEAEYAAFCPHSESRPLNLDPGYLTLAKLVLASNQGSCPSDLFKRGHLCGSDPGISPWRLEKIRMDISRLSTRGLPTVLFPVSRRSP